MLAQSAVQEPGDLLDAAKNRIHIGAVPDWIEPCSFRKDFKPKQPGQVTHLLCCQQVHAEKRQTFVHTAVRLETTHAVQNEAQGRIPFEPGSQQFTLHWLKTHRGEAVTDHTSLDNVRCAQNESDGFISQTRLTLMLMLEDIRPGDVLELCYTIEELPLLLPEQFGCLYTLPESASLGKLYFSARFLPNRQVQWASSAPDLEPVETKGDGETLWVWDQDNFPGARAEVNTPPWHIASPWIQVSDCPDWETVSTAFATAWDLEMAKADAAEIAPEIVLGEGAILQQIGKAIQLVQDQYRFLALDEPLDGKPPTPMVTVARRRYGDCKDLSVLLLLLLERLGLEARLVLVSTKLHKSLGDLLPMPTLFDHIVVEYQTRGEIRWVDATAKSQGGGSLNRVSLDYGVGLPLGQAGADLMEAPEPAVESNVYQIKESVLLDTAGASSILGIVITARGIHAEEFRRQIESMGAEALARHRLQMCVDRFIDVQRVGQMEYRDNREMNEFFLAEVFEIKNFLTEDPQSSWYKLEVGTEVVAELLPLPISGSRHSPFGLPHPCHVVHIMEVYCVALPPAILQQRTLEKPWLHYTRQRKTLAGYWTVTTTLSTLTDAIMPEEIDEYREAVREIRSQSVWSLLVPAGQDRPHQRGDFGRLPVSWQSAANAFPRLSKPAPPPQEKTFGPAARPSRRPETATQTATAPAATPASSHPGQVRFRRKKRHRRRTRESKKLLMWQAAIACLLVVVVLLLMIAVFKKVGPKFITTPPLPEGAQEAH